MVLMFIEIQPNAAPIQIRTRRRAHLGEDQPAAAHHSHGAHWSLVQPRQGTLSGENASTSCFLIVLLRLHMDVFRFNEPSAG